MSLKCAYSSVSRCCCVIYPLSQVYVGRAARRASQDIAGFFSALKRIRALAL
jgi:hypothetical protein